METKEENRINFPSLIDDVYRIRWFVYSTHASGGVCRPVTYKYAIRDDHRYRLVYTVRKLRVIDRNTERSGLKSNINVRKV